MILNALLKCAEFKGWNPDPLMDAYNACLIAEIKNEWWFKNKLVRSPDKQYYAGLYCTFDLEGYKVELTLFDKAKKEIKKATVFADGYLSFQFDWLKWSENSKSILYKFRPPQKVFEISINELLSDSIKFLPKTTSSFFK